MMSKASVIEAITVATSEAETPVRKEYEDIF